MDERLKPGNPQPNGRDARMHLLLTTETTKPAACNLRPHQARYDAFIAGYKQRRPPQALGGKSPGQRYPPSTRPDHPPAEPDEPSHDRVRDPRWPELYRAPEH